MKKTLAIVLALVMVLCMIPAMSAGTTETITDKQYDITVYSWAETALGKELGKAPAANSVTANYKYDTEEKADVTDKWAEDAKMAVIAVKGFDNQLDAKALEVTVDGKALATESYAGYIPNYCGYDPSTKTVWFPVQLTKAGYSDTYVVQVKGKNGDKTITETAKISVKLVNKDQYKDPKTATITNIVAADDDLYEAYIVGSKIYLDYLDKKDSTATVKLTFADENGKAFSVITYAYQPKVKQADGTFAFEPTKASLPDNGDKEGEVKLSSSAAKFNFATTAQDQTVKFYLETQAALYETKAYTVVARANVTAEDPKGIYFAETTKTIAMGETYAPVVMGVKTGKAVAAKLVIPKDTDKQVIDLNDDKNAVIGTREGVAYITATYSPKGLKDSKGKQVTYTSSSMKIVVTLPGESIPPVEPAATIYYVTCRNLNVRKGAGTSYAKAGMIHRGDAVEVVEIKGGWAKLANGTYVCAKYIAK